MKRNHYINFLLSGLIFLLFSATVSADGTVHQVDDVEEAPASSSDDC